MRGVWLVGLLGVLGGTIACTGDLGGVDADDEGVFDDDDTSSNTSSGNGNGGNSSGTGGDGQGGANAGSGGADSGAGGEGQGGNPAAEGLCARWNADRQQLGEGSWNGSVNSCDEGDISADGRANALRQLNLYRFIAGMPEVVTDPTRDGQAQECALMMHANNALSHNPPMGWNCYSGGGASAAGSSNIASGPGVMAVDMYMSDFGNETTMGHRRWILNNRLGPVGLGSTSGYSCMWVIGGSGNANFDWMAWPSAGVFPIEALTTSFQSVDSNKLLAVR